MSLAIKISNMRQAELAINRLNDNINEQRHHLKQQMDRNLAQAQQTARDEARRAADRMRADFDRKLANAVSGVEAGIRRVDEQQRRRIEAVASNMQRVIAEADRAVRADMKEAFDAVARNMRRLENHINEGLQWHQKQLDTQRNRLNDHEARIGELTQTVNGIIDHIKSTEARRAEAVKLARGACDSAKSVVDIARFCPEQSHDIERRLAAIEANPNDEGTVALATDIMLRVQDAAEEATRRKIIYEALLTQAIESVSGVLTEVNSNRAITVAHPEDPAETVTLESDFWSRGEYGKVAAAIEALRRELDSEPSTERITEIAEESARLHARSRELVEEASRQAILSENRVTITEDILTALQRQGWQIERRPDGTDAVDYLGGEVDNDWREGVFAIVKSVAGDNITIVVEPDENGLENRLIFQRNDNRQLNGAEYLRTVQRICDQISQSGHRLDAPREPRNGGDHRIPELTNAERLTKKGTAKAIKTQAKR